MAMSKAFDLVIKNARVVRPKKTSVDCLDIAIRNGKIERLAPDVPAEQAEQVFDGRNHLAFPGCVDAHSTSEFIRRFMRTRFQKAKPRRWAASLQAELHSNRPLLPQSRRSLSRLHSGSAQAKQRTLLG